MSQSGPLTTSIVSTAAETLTGNIGGPVGPDLDLNINILGGDSIDVAGNPGTNTLDVDLTVNVQETAIHGWNGSTLEDPDVTVTSDGATITASVEGLGGGDLTVVFSDGFFIWDTTPADTITLTAGTDPFPQQNFLFFLQSTKVLTVNTTGFPTAEHNAVATIICQSAASLQTQGAIKIHLWTDHIKTVAEQGHLTDINAWIRNQNATWVSGVTQSFNLTPNVGVPDNVTITTTAGSVFELHPHVYPAFDNPIDYFVINDFTTPYTVVNDLNALLTDSTGSSMSGRFFSIVLWGVVGTVDSDKLFINLPSGSYNNSTSLSEDVGKFANFSIPQEFKGAAFLIAQWNLRHQTTSGGTWTSVEEIDLRGLVPSLAPGGTTVSLVEFSDNLFRVFDDIDDTKKIAFEASPVTTATTRTITMVDADLDLAEVTTTFTCDTGTALGSSNAVSLIGSGGIATTGAGSTITVVGAGETEISITPLDNTDSPYTVLSTDYYMSCDVSAGVLTVLLPNAPTTGKVFIVKDSTGDSTTNNITVTTVGGVVTIDGTTSRVIATDFLSLSFVFNGTSYEVF